MTLSIKSSTNDIAAWNQVAKTFPYKSYAELMTRVSVGGINPGELCPIQFTNFGISQNALDIFNTLLRKGYKLILL